MAKANDQFYFYSEDDFSKKISRLESALAEIKGADLEESTEEKRQRIAASLPFDVFCKVIQDALGSEIRMEDLKGPYRKLTTNPEGKIDWAEFFGYFQTEGELQEFQWVEDVTVFSVNKKKLVGDAAGAQRKRDCVQGLKVIHQLDSLLTISQKGIISIWGPSLRLSSMTDLKENTWATGIDFMEGFKRVVATTERSMHIFDHRTKGDNQQIFSIKPLTESPRCLCWIPMSKHVLEDTLVFGDDQGKLHLVTVTTRDFTPKQKTGPNKLSQFVEVDPQHLSVPIKKRQIHGDWVMQVKYFPELKCLASCSSCPKKSFFLSPLERIWKPEKSIQTIAIPKGVNCFDYCVRANVVITGGVDKILRVWHPHIWSRPTGKLSGHLFSICALVCNQADQHIISLSTARVIRVWDIQTMACLQVFSDADDRPGEKRIYVMDFDQKFNRLLTGSSVIESWPLTRAEQDIMLVPQSHDRPVVFMIFNSLLNQLITVCAQPVIKVWALDSAQTKQHFAEPLGVAVEITALAVNHSGYRMAIGGADGSVKVIDLSSGHDIRHKQGYVKEDEPGIVGLEYCVLQEKQCILVMGWRNKMKLFLDKNENDKLFPLLMEMECGEWIPPIGRTNSFLTQKSLRQDPSASEHNLGELNPYTVLPHIVREGSRSTKITTSSSFHHPLLMQKRESLDRGIFKSWDIVCYDFYAPNLIILGCANADVLLFRLDKMEVALKIPTYEWDTAEEDEPQVYCVKLIPGQTKTPVVERQSSTSSNTDPMETANQSDVNQQINASEKSPNVVIDNLSHATIDTAKKLASEISHVTQQSQPDSTEKLFIISTHGDGRLRVWNLSGHPIWTVTPDVPVAQIWTAMAFHAEKQLLMVGSKAGYITCLKCTQLLTAPPSSSKQTTSSEKRGTLMESPLVIPLNYWRAHLHKVSRLAFVGDYLASASVDGSVRLYIPENAQYVGFFGQVRAFKYPKENTLDLTVVATNMPYDITERPVMSKIMNKDDSKKIQVNKNAQFPLKFEENRWDAFNRTRFLKERDDKTLARETTKENITKNLEKKYFKAIVKPKVNRTLLEIDEPASSPRESHSVFSSLPVYRVRTPEKVSPPEGIQFYDLTNSSQLQGKRNKKDAQPKKDNQSQKLG